MNLRSILDNTKYTRLFALSALLFLALGGWFTLAGRTEQDRADSLNLENEEIKTFSALPESPSALPFLQELLRPVSGESLAASLETTGVKVNSISEEEGEEGPRGEIKKFRISGTADFPQMVQSFGIINSKNRWCAMDLRSLKRAGDVLAYEVEIRTFQSRGTYDQEKHRPHRSYGNREKPGSKNPL